MINWFKSKKIDELKREIEYLKSTVKSTQRQSVEIMKDYDEKMKSPTKVIEVIMGRGIDWFDYHKLDKNGWRDYHGDARAALMNKTLQNEIKHITADFIEHIAKRSKDFKEVEILRANINAFEVLKERLEKIENPEEKISKDNIHDAV